MLKTVVTDKGEGTGQRVFPDQSALVSSSGIPPFGQDVKTTTVRELFVDEAGSSDMAVVASVAAPQFFSVKASPDGTIDRWIKSISFLVSATGAGGNEWGTGPPLTDPIIVSYEQEDGSHILSDAIFTNFDLVRLAGGQPAFGTGSTTMVFPNAIGSTGEAFIPVLDLEKIFGIPFGLRLAAGTEQKITITIQDDTTSADLFDAIAYGMDRRE